MAQPGLTDHRRDEGRNGGPIYVEWGLVSPDDTPGPIAIPL